MRGLPGEAAGGWGRSYSGQSHMPRPAPAVPPAPPDHITLPLALMFEDVAVAATNFSFYDCGAIQALEVAAP